MSDDADNAQAVIDIMEQTKIKAIREAILAKGSYYCEQCGMDIDPERQKVVPWATTCFTCQNIIEHRTRVGIK